MKFNGCIIGAGAIFKCHADALRAGDNSVLYGVCDIDKEKADKVAEEYKIKAFYSFDEVLKDERVDVVHICTPHYLHYEMIEKAILSGKKVIVEKPPVTDKEELYKIINNGWGDEICVMFQNRTNPCVKKLFEIAKTENIKAIRGFLTWHRDEKYYNSAPWRGTKAFEKGGVLINQAIHTLDIMSVIAGEHESVKATLSNKCLENVIETEDTVDAIIKYKSGTSGVLYATVSYGENSSYFVEFTSDDAIFRYCDSKLYKIKGESVEIITDELTKNGEKAYFGYGHKKAVAQFYDFLASGKGDFISLSSAVNTMKLLFAIYNK